VSAESLQSALDASGMRAVVEGRERLAIITPADNDSARIIAKGRARIVTLASAHGFSHVALEVVATPLSDGAARGDAALPGN
jgi:hypothetical protein